jgi:hypothetical protein
MAISAPPKKREARALGSERNAASSKAQLTRNEQPTSAGLDTTAFPSAAGHRISDIAILPPDGEDRRDIDARSLALGSPPITATPTADAVQRQKAPEEGVGVHKGRLPPVDDGGDLDDSNQTADSNVHPGVQDVIPNDTVQQTMALIGATTAEEVFDLDGELVAEVRSIAQVYAEVQATKAMSTAAAESGKRLREELGHAPSTPEEMEQADMGAEAAMETVFEATVDQRFAELRGKFIKWGGRVLFKRSTGKAALKRLAKEEKALVKRERGSATLSEQIIALRQRHADAFRPKLADIKLRFLQGARERFLFWFEKQMNVRPNEKMRRLPDTAEGSTKLKDLDGLITGEPDLEVANSVVLFARMLKATSPVSIDISTYEGHSWDRYSLDLFPQVAKDSARGLYDADTMVDVFLKINEAAALSGVKWRALYNDFDVARRVNQSIGMRKVSFQWEHGPAPYVLHVHVDLTPRVLEATLGAAAP